MVNSKRLRSKRQLLPHDHEHLFFYKKETKMLSVLNVLSMNRASALSWSHQNFTFRLRFGFGFAERFMFW